MPQPRANRDALCQIMAYWLDRGVAGFQADMAYSLVKDDPGFSATVAPVGGPGLSDTACLTSTRCRRTARAAIWRASAPLHGFATTRRRHDSAVSGNRQEFCRLTN